MGGPDPTHVLVTLTTFKMMPLGAAWGTPAPGGHAISAHRPRPVPGRCIRHAVRAAVVGIDLGTSNSAVAVLEDGAPRVLRNSQGNAAVPSMVAIAQARG